MTYSDKDLSVTTWGHDTEKQPVWRANDGERTVEFTAARDAEAWWLLEVGGILLGKPLSGNGASLLEEPEGKYRAPEVLSFEGGPRCRCSECGAMVKAGDRR
jgi:hypothetical protein